MVYREDQHDVHAVTYDDGIGTTISGRTVNTVSTVGSEYGKDPIPFAIIVQPKSIAANVLIIGARTQAKIARATTEWR